MSTINTKNTERAPSEADIDDVGGPTGAGNIDQIREILFGVQMEDYERRFAALEERLAQEAADLRSDTTNRLDSLETYVKQELRTLTESLKVEHNERAKADKGVSRELSTLGTNLERRIGRVDEALAERAGALDSAISERTRELRDHLLEQSKALRDELTRTRDALTTALTSEVAELARRKADRTHVATLLAEAAARLADENGSGHPES